MRTFEIGSRFVAVAVILLALAGIAAPVATAAEGERVLDPTLSLTGGCKEESLDQVKDPSCPSTPPAGEFASPYAVGTDSHGDIYVASQGKAPDGSEGRVDIFSPKGLYITELPVVAPEALAIDSTGVLYVWSSKPGKLFRYEPCGGYNPAAGQIEFCQPPAVVTLTGPKCAENPRYYLCTRGGGAEERVGLAIDSSNDHLFAIIGESFVEYSSTQEGNEELRFTFIEHEGLFTGTAVGLAVDSAHHRIYAQAGVDQIAVFELDEGLLPQEEYEKIDAIKPGASGVPGGRFGQFPSLAVDEGTGHLFVYDTENSHLWELDETGNYLATVDFPLQAGAGGFGMEIAVDNGPASPNGKLSEEAGRGRYLFVPSNPKGTGHSYAFFVATVAPPEVLTTAATDVGEEEAALNALIDPNNLQTTYVFDVKAEGAAEWTRVGEGTIAAGNLNVAVAAAATELSPGTHYNFRVVVVNEKGSDEANGSFATYPSLPVEPSPCANALLRTGHAALLPDCRAYELVTPPDTNARAPLGPAMEGGGFTTRQVSPAGDKVPFRVEGGALPGLGGVGGLKGDPYLATRTPSGWSTAAAGPPGSEAVAISPGTPSPDQGYSFWEAGGEGPAVDPSAAFTTYVRHPDGHSELVGQGSLGTDPEVSGKLISEGGGHIIFATGPVKSLTAIQLEPEAAPGGTKAIYDHTSDGVTHVVSLQPGNLPFSAGENAEFKGISLDGTSVAFKVDEVLYLRYDNQETFRIGEGVKFAGVDERGGRIFYMEGDNLEAFDVATESVIQFADTLAPVVPVTVSADGSTAYFVSKSVVPASGLNPEGAKAKSGAQNLYRSKEGQTTFIGAITERDVVGTSNPTFGDEDGLGLWVPAIGADPSLLARVPARSTPDGNVFLFKSRATLTDYNPGGHAEIYRYDSVEGSLQCLSCTPSGALAQSDANLQSRFREGSELFDDIAWPEDLRADGRRAFFESSEPLVAEDTDGRQDVYEWEEQGVGSCTQPNGCIYLISSPQSQRNEYLWAISRSGDDVFFLSSDLLVGRDADVTPSIYDARVGGGFAEPGSATCEGEGCRPHLSNPPSLSAGETPVRGPGDSYKPRTCGKGKHKVKRAGKVRCVKKHHRHQHRAHGVKRGGQR